MVDLKPVAAVGTILLLGQLGSATGDALADVLLGKSYPSGKLTMTWAPIEDYASTEGCRFPVRTFTRIAGQHIDRRISLAVKRQLIFRFRAASSHGNINEQDQDRIAGGAGF